MRSFLTAVILFCALLCTAQDKKLYVVPDSAKGLKISTIIEEATLIPLQTTKAAGFNNVVNFIVTNDNFVFSDNTSNSILVFDKKGNFLHKFKKRRYSLRGLQYIPSKNAVFFKSLNKNFSIPVKKANELMKNPGNRDFSRYVNLELVHLDANENYRIEPLPVPPFALGDIYHINRGYLLQRNRYNRYEKDTILYHLNLIENDTIVKSYFPFINLPGLATDYDDVGININRTSADSVFYIQKDYDHTIYKLVNDSLYPAYNFVFPASNSIPADFFTTRFKNNLDFVSYKEKNAKAIKSFYNIIDTRDLLFFGIRDNAWGYKRLLFNKNSSTVYDLEKATSDSVTYYLPSNILSGMGNYDGEYLYTTISANELLKEKEKILARYKDTLPPPLLVKILNGIDKFSNAVVIRFKLKTDIAK